jgi:hypothetical protein
LQRLGRDDLPKLIGRSRGVGEPNQVPIQLFVDAIDSRVFSNLQPQVTKLLDADLAG